MSISADGYVAGPGQCQEHPGGIGGIALHEWHRGAAKDHPINRQVNSEMLDGMGATIMGRNMFGPISGPWGDSDCVGCSTNTPVRTLDVVVGSSCGKLCCGLTAD